MGSAVAAAALLEAEEAGILGWDGDRLRFTHPLLKKTVRRTKNYHAHDENKTFKVGDMVSIEETKPISKLKRWAVIRGEKRAKSEAPIEVESEKRSAKKKGGSKAEKSDQVAAKPN